MRPQAWYLKVATNAKTRYHSANGKKGKGIRTMMEEEENE
jgi:hypothetical protein